MEPTILLGFIVGLASILLGFAVYLFKLDWIISGYNTLPKEKKENINIEKIRLLFLSFFAIGGTILILNGILTLLFEIKFIHPLAIVVLILLFLIVNYTIGKFDKNISGGMPTIYRFFRRM